MTANRLPATPSFRLDGKRALVTGGPGRGIGMALSVALAQAGARVTLCSRTVEETESIAEQIRLSGGCASAVVLDVTDVIAVQRYVQQQAPFDILVNNAGTNRPGPFVDVSVEDFDFVSGLNLRASFSVAQAVAKRLVSAGQAGTIVNVSSQMGHVGAVNRSVYCATKFGIEGLTKALAVELGPRHIRVNSICPTFIETAMTSTFLDDEQFRQDVLSKIKLGRLGQIEDVMGAVVFLCSKATALVTGTSLLVDGGWTSE